MRASITETVGPIKMVSLLAIEWRVQASEHESEHQAGLRATTTTSSKAGFMRMCVSVCVCALTAAAATAEAAAALWLRRRQRSVVEQT